MWPVCNTFFTIFHLCTIKVKWGVRTTAIFNKFTFRWVTFKIISGCKFYTTKQVVNMGQKYHGAIGYADDISLIAPPIYALNKMCDICLEFASGYIYIYIRPGTEVLVLVSSNAFLKYSYSSKLWSLSRTRSMYSDCTSTSMYFFSMINYHENYFISYFIKSLTTTTIISKSMVANCITCI